MPYRPPVFKPAQSPSYEQQRGSAQARGYNNTWHRLARRYRQAHPLCLGCLAVGWTTVAECVDHVMPHRGDPALMWNQANLQAACRWHHDVVKQRLEHEWAQGRASIDDLKLDSSRAVALTKQLETTRF